MSNVAQLPQFRLEDYARPAQALARYSTMKVGGPARWWAEPADEAALSTLLRGVQREGVPLFVLGAGSNLVISDSGFEGVVLHLGKEFAWHRAEGNRLMVGGAMLLPKLTHVALDYGLGNFEWACGVPGSVGGSIWGNAGARGFNGQGFESRDASADLESLVAFDRAGERHVLRRDEIEFSYRRSSLGELIVTEATYVLKPLSEEETRRHREAVKELLRIRRDTQPANARSAGCIWKNPKMEGCAGAGQLIEQLGLKGHQIGGAAISAVHANFIVNTGDATSADIHALIEDVERKAREAVGVQLEREVRFLGS